MNLTSDDLDDLFSNPDSHMVADIKGALRLRQMIDDGIPMIDLRHVTHLGAYVDPVQTDLLALQTSIAGFWLLHQTGQRSHQTLGRRRALAPPVEGDDH